MDRLELIKSLKNRGIKLVAVSKYVDEKAIIELAKLGVQDFGENKIQALRTKQASIDMPLNWHFIGNLQSNKINAMIEARPILWQSCVGLDQALKVNKRLDYKLDTLLEVNFADEDTKMGCPAKSAKDQYLAIKRQCKNLNLLGIMSIGAMDKAYTKESFEATHALFKELEEEGAKVCSMGMSADYELAISCGANMVRIGSLLFN